jgi:hypothetical protein
MPHITSAAYKAWQQSYCGLPFAEWLEQQKQAGKFWGA